MLLLKEHDCVGIYLHKPTGRVIGITPTLGNGYLKVQLEPMRAASWGSIVLCDRLQLDILNEQSINGEIEWLKPPDFSFQQHRIP